MKQVVPASFCETTFKSLLSYLQNMGTGIDPEDRSTWKNKNWPSTQHGIIQHYHVGHQDFVWKVRERKEIIDVFAQLWGTEKLLVSFDGVSLMQYSSVNGGWEHVDQGMNKSGFQVDLYSYLFYVLFGCLKSDI